MARSRVTTRNFPFLLPAGILTAHGRHFQKQTSFTLTILGLCIHFRRNILIHFSHSFIFRKVMHIMKTLFSRTAKVLDEMGKRGKKAKRR